MPMVLGIDFDNTIVRYDELFHGVAVERGLIPASLPVRKNDVRDFLRQQDRERDWTELQGYVYGPRMAGARPFPIPYALRLDPMALTQGATSLLRANGLSGCCWLKCPSSCAAPPTATSPAPGPNAVANSVFTPTPANRSAAS